jgi:hypothetical protein
VYLSVEKYRWVRHSWSVVCFPPFLLRFIDRKKNPFETMDDELYLNELLLKAAEDGNLAELKSCLAEGANIEFEDATVGLDKQFSL